MAAALRHASSSTLRAAGARELQHFVLHGFTREDHRQRPAIVACPHPLVGVVPAHQAQVRSVASSALADVVAATAGVAAGPGITMLSFTPAHAALGGAILGIATAGKLLTTGRVLGISGAVKGLVHNDMAPWRFAFLLGMGLGALALAGGAVPGALEALPASFTVWRTALGGLLVGLGAALGNGCTSGHGICGSARLSVRSFAYTGTFMASGMAAATLAHTASALGLAPLAPPLLLPTAAEMQLAGVIAAAGVAAFAAIALAARAAASAPALGAGGKVEAGGSEGGLQAREAPAALEVSAELAAGGLFALGLGFSGMTRPSKVAAFLSVTYPGWDLTLPFVMGGAVLVAAVAFQGVQRFRLLSKPLVCSRFQLPSSSLIDGKLLLGGVLFGAGWGISGMCPGPAIVAAVAGQPQVLAYLGAMLVGMAAEGRLSAWMGAAGEQQLKRSPSE